MIVPIYNYLNEISYVELPNKTIVEIYVNVLSGDETGYFLFEDGTRVPFDADFHTRNTDHYDGHYIVRGDEINRWVNFETNGITVSYERLDSFRPKTRS